MKTWIHHTILHSQEVQTSVAFFCIELFHEQKLKAICFPDRFKNDSIPFGVNLLFYLKSFSRRMAFQVIL